MSSKIPSFRRYVPAPSLQNPTNTENVPLLLAPTNNGHDLIIGVGSSTPQSYSPGSSKNAECSNCKHLLDKITVLKATVDMYMHPEQHIVNSAALLHEVYNDMGKLSLE
ncbi:hypothetical protein Tco_0945253 [Tanacetum coccineum]